MLAHAPLVRRQPAGRRPEAGPRPAGAGRLLAGRTAALPDLQHAVGNRVVSRLLQRGPTSPADPPAPPPFTVTGATLEVTPKGTDGNHTATLKVSGARPKGKLRVAVEAVQSTGHDHAGAGRPLGRVTPKGAKADASGEATLTYTSGVVAGEERVTVTGAAKPGETAPQAAVALTVRVPGLTELPAGAGYELVGATSTHAANHFGTPETVAALQAIAVDFAAIPNRALVGLAAQWAANAVLEALTQMPAAPGSTRKLSVSRMAALLSGTDAAGLADLSDAQLGQLRDAVLGWPRLGYNDLSLAAGGLFDIKGDWAPPHKTHRMGQTLDFRTNHLNDLHRRVARPIIEAHGATVLNEGDHWHLTFG
ncbi:MAG: hypothetical protein JNK29_17830 [Anaerolineales bacterium]|nr:hypothetical protein [Anaerolineales bacterium]